MIVETSYRKQAIKYYSICTSVHVEDEDENSPEGSGALQSFGG